MTYLLRYDVGADKCYWQEATQAELARARHLNETRFNRMGIPYNISDKPNPLWPIREAADA